MEHDPTCLVYARGQASWSREMRATGRGYRVRKLRTRMERERCSCAKSDLAVRLRKLRRALEKANA